MNARRAQGQQLAALLDAEFDAGFQGLLRIGSDGFEDVVYFLRNGSAARGAETDKTVVIGDGKDARNDAFVDPEFPKPRDVIKILFIVEEKLGNDKVRAGIHFSFEIDRILRFVRRKHMSFRKSRHGNTEIITEILTHKGNQFIGIMEIVLTRFPVGPFFGRIAAQSQNIADVAAFNFLEDVFDLCFGMHDARQVRHTRDIVCFLDMFNDVDRLIAAASAGAVGAGNEVGF